MNVTDHGCDDMQFHPENSVFRGDLIFFKTLLKTTRHRLE